MNWNKCTFAGNVTKPLELKALPSGQSVCSFSLAINRVYKDKAGVKQEQVEFVNFVVFGQTADTMAKWVVKGQNILVDSRVQTRSWDKTEFVVENFQFGQKPQGMSAPQKPKDEDGLEGYEDNEPAKPKEIEYPTDEINPDDIPF